MYTFFGLGRCVADRDVEDLGLSYLSAFHDDALRHDAHFGQLDDSNAGLVEDDAVTCFAEGPD